MASDFHSVYLFEVDLFALHESQRHRQQFDQNTSAPMPVHNVQGVIGAIFPMSSREVQASERGWVGLVSSVYG